MNLSCRHHVLGSIPFLQKMNLLWIIKINFINRHTKSMPLLPLSTFVGGDFFINDLFSDTGDICSFTQTMTNWRSSSINGLKNNLKLIMWEWSARMHSLMRDYRHLINLITTLDIVERRLDDLIKAWEEKKAFNSLSNLNLKADCIVVH